MGKQKGRTYAARPPCSWLWFTPLRVGSPHSPVIANNFLVFCIAVHNLRVRPFVFLDVRQRPNFYPAPVHDERRGRKALGAGQLPHAAPRVAPTGDKVGLSKPVDFLGWWGLRAVLHGGMHRGFGGGGVGCFLACRMAGYGSPDGEPARIDNCQCISAHSVGSASRPAAGRGRRPSRLLAPCQSSRGVGFAASVPARSFQPRGISPAAGALVLALTRGALCSPLSPPRDIRQRAVMGG